MQCRASSEQQPTVGPSGVTSDGRPFSYQQTDLSDAQAHVDPRTGSEGEAGGGATRAMGQGGADLYVTP